MQSYTEQRVASKTNVHQEVLYASIQMAVRFAVMDLEYSAVVAIAVALYCLSPVPQHTTHAMNSYPNTLGLA
jgi:hypothetical protein